MPAALRDTRRMNQFVSVAAAVAGLLFGLDIGVIAGALPFITDHFTLSNRLQEWVVSSMMLGAAIGALFNGWLSFRLGRKYSLMVGAILFVAGSIGSAFATNIEVLLLSRVLLGVAVGIASYTAPLYLSEKKRFKVSLVCALQYYFTVFAKNYFLHIRPLSFRKRFFPPLLECGLPSLQSFPKDQPIV